MGTRPLLVSALLAAALGLAADAEAAVTASVSSGTLKVTGGAVGERIALRAASGGRLVVDVGDNGSPNFIFLRSRFTKIVVNGRGGNDRLRVNEAHGAFTSTEKTTFNGGRGADTLIGGRFGETLNSGDGNDSVDANAGPDKVALGGGADALVWNAGDGVDRVDGGADSDAVSINGTSGANAIIVGAVSGHVVVGSGPDLFSVESVRVNGLGGGDTLSGGAIASLTQLTLDGGEGNDTLNGGNGADLLLGGAGTDTVDGNVGNDVALLGTGSDLFIWDPGDGSDTVEGQANADTLRFNGSAGAEIFAASSNGGRLLFTRNIGNIVMDVDDVETLALNALGGTDSVSVNDLTATDVGAVDVDLGVGGLGDAAADAVTVNGTVAIDLVGLSGSGSVDVTIPAYGISLVRAEPTNDTLTVNLSSGADVLTAAGLAASSVLLTVNGGAGDDALVGSAGADTINGDAGNDYLNGGDGNDTLNGGADFDTIDGGAGIDTAANGENVINVP